MKQKRFTVDQIIPKLREADVDLGKGMKVPDVCKKLGITTQTYYRWRQKYGGMAPDMAKELKAVQKENARLKKLVAEQALDMEILKEAPRETGRPRAAAANHFGSQTPLGAKPNIRASRMPRPWTATFNATLRGNASSEGSRIAKGNASSCTTAPTVWLRADLQSARGSRMAGERKTSPSIVEAGSDAST